MRSLLYSYLFTSDSVSISHIFKLKRCFYNILVLIIIVYCVYNVKNHPIYFGQDEISLVEMTRKEINTI